MDYTGFISAVLQTHPYHWIGQKARTSLISQLSNDLVNSRTRNLATANGHVSEPLGCSTDTRCRFQQLSPLPFVKYSLCKQRSFIFPSHSNQSAERTHTVSSHVTYQFLCLCKRRLRLRTSPILLSSRVRSRKHYFQAWVLPDNIQTFVTACTILDIRSYASHIWAVRKNRQRLLHFHSFIYGTTISATLFYVGICMFSRRRV